MREVRVSPVVQDGPYLLQGLGHIEADVGDRVPSHTQDRGQHVLGGDVLPTDLGQHLGGSVSGRGPLPRVHGYCASPLPSDGPPGSPGLRGKLSNPGGSEPGCILLNLPSHLVLSSLPVSPPWKPRAQATLVPPPQLRFPFNLWGWW